MVAELARKHHYVVTEVDYHTLYATMADATARAKQQTAKQGKEYVIYEAVNLTKVPTPEIEMTEISKAIVA